jgi:hypothetical protein
MRNQPVRALFSYPLILSFSLGEKGPLERPRLSNAVTKLFTEAPIRRLKARGFQIPYRGLQKS